MLFQRLRGRLDSLQSDATVTMEDVRLLILDANDLVRELKDGVTVFFVREGEHSIFDFLRGKCDTLPIGIRIDVLEKGERK